MVNPENIHACSMIQTEQIIFKGIYLYKYAYVNAITISE